MNLLNLQLTDAMPQNLQEFFKRNKKKVLIIFLTLLIFVFLMTLIQNNQQPKPQREVFTPATPTPVSAKGLPIITPITKEGPLSPEEEASLQTEADVNTARWWEAVYRNYPWYDKLPLKSGDYFVYFKIETESFMAKIYKNDSQELRSLIISKLTALGIDTIKYPIEWKILQSTPAP